MTLTQIIAILTPFLTFVPLASLIVTLMYQHNSRLQESKIRRRDSIHDYSITLITALRHYTDTQFRYMSERMQLERDRMQNKPITAERSKYIYDLKDKAIQEQIESDVIAENAKLEISQVDFPGIHHEITKLVKHIQIIMNDPAFQNYDKLRDLELQVLQNEVKTDITKLTLLLTKTQDQITAEIHELTYLNPWRKKTDDGTRSGKSKY